MTLNILREKWMRLAECIGTTNARIILTILYFSMVAPFALFLRMRADSLRLKQRKRATYWIPRPRREASFEEMMRQF